METKEYVKRYRQRKRDQGFVQMTVLVSEDIHRLVKERALNNSMTMSEVVQEALEEYFTPKGFFRRLFGG